VAAGIFVVVVMVNAAVMRVEKIVMMSLSVFEFGGLNLNRLSVFQKSNQKYMS
jgi:hypothetical protein